MSRSKFLAVVALFFKKLTKRLPSSVQTDRLYALARFVSFHGRFPKRGGLYNDRLFFVKWDGDLDDDFIRTMTDKELVKDFIGSVVGKRHLVPTLAVLRSDEEIDAYSFPQACFVKGTAHSGAVLCTEDGQIDRKRLKRWLRSTHHKVTRERNYLGLTPKIIVEPFVFGSRFADDVKFYVYKGRVGVVHVDFDRHRQHTRRVYSRQWQELKISFGKPEATGPYPRPACLDEMVAAAEKLGAHFDFVRVDMYVSGNEFRIGELTHCPGSADRIFYPEGAEEMVSELVFGGEDVAAPQKEQRLA